MRTILLLIVFAWLITTNQTSIIRDNQDGTYTVEHKQYCTEIEPSYKANDLIIKNGTKEVILRIDQYTVEKVANCPGG